MLIDIVTPDKNIFSGDISSATFPGSDGSFGIKENHAPMVATLKEGKIYIGRNTDEIMVVFDDEFSSQPDDVFIIDYIAYKLAGNEPEQTINVKLLNTDDVEFSWLPFPMPYVEINNFDKVISTRCI